MNGYHAADRNHRLLTNQRSVRDDEMLQEWINRKTGQEFGDPSTSPKQERKFSYDYSYGNKQQSTSFAGKWTSGWGSSSGGKSNEDKNWFRKRLMREKEEILLDDEKALPLSHWWRLF